ncbi:hypothetical protein Q5P01_005964 [Channa striata]|uniref:G-protein coupled receptors family 1 profile domain-containing protein n=1 Tax=Channa striata TaxID=64152 RepID=A0AA88SZZ7_CHASR|nr:hypothetical protein Q5P01_005964 [Channa striata]
MEEAELCFPQLLNASCRKPQIIQSAIVLMYLMFFFSVFTVILNLLVIISLHTPTNLLLLSLAVSDLLFGLVTPLEAHRQTGCWLLGDVMCTLHIFLGSLSVCASEGEMIFISFDRYLAVCDPLRYPTRVTVKKVQMCVCMWWIFSVVYCVAFYKVILIQPGRYNSCYGKCVFYIDYISGTVDTVLSVIGPITVIIILYMRVFVVAVSQARAMRSHVAAVTLQHSGNVTTKKSELKAARTLGVVIGVYLICFFPYYYVLSSFVLNCPVDMFVEALAIFMMYINPCLNPVIYALFYPWFRKAIRLIFSLQILQPGSREIYML